MTNLIGAEKSQRLLNRKGYRRGTFVRTLLMSLGQIDKMVTAAYVSDVSIRGIGDVTEQLLGKLGWRHFLQ